MKNSILLIFVFIASSLSTNAQCTVGKIGFGAGEKISYDVHYHWGLVWANAGSATFSVENAVFAGKNAYHFIGEGSSRKNWDWFFKVRDRFDSWVDAEQLKPLRYIRNTQEGGNRTHNDSYFFYGTKKIHLHNYSNSKQPANDTLALIPCLYDVMTTIYYARTLNFTNAKVGTTIAYNMYLDGKIYKDLYIKYLGKEKITTALGEIMCVKFSPKLIEGTVFKSGDGMVVWVTDDDAHTPVQIKAPIVVGEVLIKITNLKQGDVVK